MRVREFIEWLAQFPDQDATVEVLECRPGAPYVQQGGVTSSVEFDPEKLAAWAIDKPSARSTMPFARRRGAGLFEVTASEPEHLPEE